MDVTRRTLVRAAAAATVLGAGGAFAYGRRSSPGDAPEPTALVAGSLLHVCTSIPGASVEAHGSAAVRRLIVEGLREPDAVALADPRLFEDVSDRATLFATNALVITFDPQSPHADALRRDWRTAVADTDVEIGRTDPDQDPLGYRTVMALELAEQFYGIDASAVLDSTRIFRETDVLNVVEQGAIDAAFTYRSMATERDLPAVALPARIDFSRPEQAETYASVSYDLDHATVTGSPIRYAATATTDRGEGWVESLVTARAVLEDNGFVVPPEYPIYDERLAFPDAS